MAPGVTVAAADRGVVGRAVPADHASAAAPPVRAWPIAVYPAVGVLAAYGIMRLFFGFDLVVVFLRLAADAVAFNQHAGRGYWIWLVDNLREFLLGAGVVGSIVLCVSVYRVGGDLIHDARTSGLSGAIRRAVADPVTNLLLFATLTLLTLDVMGLNRGEVTRLWIFLSVALQISIASLCVTRYGPSTTRAGRRDDGVPVHADGDHGGFPGVSMNVWMRVLLGLAAAPSSGPAPGERETADRVEDE